jgi:hypothetical protein
MKPTGSPATLFDSPAFFFSLQGERLSNQVNFSVIFFHYNLLYFLYEQFGFLSKTYRVGRNAKFTQNTETKPT